MKIGKGNGNPLQYSTPTQRYLNFKALEEKKILSTSREKKLIRGIRNYTDFRLHNSITASKKKMELCPES